MKSKNLLLIFTRNPELGKVKSRLAKDIGAEKALTIYKLLLGHTQKITQELDAEKWVFYSEEIHDEDIWSAEHFSKKQQIGDDLGIRMKNAFEKGFEHGYEKIIIIGSDIYDLQQTHIEQAFISLDKHNSVIGPSDDGGYYLLGMKNLIDGIFENKNWGSNTVLANTISNLETHVPFFTLENLNDIDVISDIKTDSYLRNFI